jgi:hypothetical protein
MRTFSESLILSEKIDLTQKNGKKNGSNKTNNIPISFITKNRIS